MPNLDNLIEKILKDCETEAKRVTAEAEAEAAAIIAKSETAANREREEILSGAADEAAKTAERILLSRRLEVRDSALAAKRDAIENAFKVALLNLNSMTEDKFNAFLTSGLKAIGAQNGVLILPERFRHISVDNLPGGHKLYQGSRVIGGGFILIVGGVEYNRTFETLLQYYRYELESDIIKTLA